MHTRWCRLKVPDGVPPWLESIKAKEVELSNAWSGNSILRQKFLDEFIKDSLHAEISAIARYDLLLFRARNTLLMVCKDWARRLLLMNIHTSHLHTSVRPSQSGRQSTKARLCWSNGSTGMWWRNRCTIWSRIWHGRPSGTRPESWRSTRSTSWKRSTNANNPSTSIWCLSSETTTQGKYSHVRNKRLVANISDPVGYFWSGKNWQLCNQRPSWHFFVEL